MTCLYGLRAISITRGSFANAKKNVTVNEGGASSAGIDFVCRFACILNVRPAIIWLCRRCPT